MLLMGICLFMIRNSQFSKYTCQIRQRLNRFEAVCPPLLRLEITSQQSKFTTSVMGLF